MPSKELSDGGLGVGWNAWHALVDDVKDKYLPERPPYSGLVIGNVLIDTTLDKALRALSSEMVKRIKLERDHS